MRMENTVETMKACLKCHPKHNVDSETPEHTLTDTYTPLYV